MLQQLTDHASRGGSLTALLDGLFFAAGVCLLAHMGLCVWLQSRLRDHEDLIREIFAVPNEFLTRGRNVSFRLLRARFYLPRPLPLLGDSRLDLIDRIVLAAARITGFMMPVAALLFFVVSFVQATN